MGIHTERLTLRPFTLDDTAFILELVNTPGWLQFIGDRHIHTPEQARQYLENGPLKSYEQHGFGLYRVSLKTDDTPIGMCGLLKRDTLPHPDIGFAFLPAHTGQGYAYEAATAVQAFAHNTLGISTLCAIVLPTNATSIRLLEKIGMVYVEPFWQNGTELRLYRA